MSTQKVLINSGHKCHQCNQAIFREQDCCGTGYGYDSQDNKICYSCCAESDRQHMKDQGKITLYLSGENGNLRVTNWPGTLCIKVRSHSEGLHNIAGVRYDVWFIGPDGFVWWGVQYGHWTQICHCKRTKMRPGR